MRVNLGLVALAVMGAGLVAAINLGSLWFAAPSVGIVLLLAVWDGHTTRRFRGAQQREAQAAVFDDPPQDPAETAQRVGVATMLSRMWRVTYVPSDWTVVALYRAWLLSLPLYVATLLILPIALGSNLLLHRVLIPGRVLLMLVGLTLLPSILRQLLRVRMAMVRGYWTRKGVPVTRTEQTSRYWFWTSAELLSAALPAAAGAWMVWFAATMN